jgi:hypothetical protein
MGATGTAAKSKEFVGRAKRECRVCARAAPYRGMHLPGSLQRERSSNISAHRLEWWWPKWTGPGYWCLSRSARQGNCKEYAERGNQHCFAAETITHPKTFGDADGSPVHSMASTPAPDSRQHGRCPPRTS